MHPLTLQQMGFGDDCYNLTKSAVLTSQLEGQAASLSAPNPLQSFWQVREELLKRGNECISSKRCQEMD